MAKKKSTPYYKQGWSVGSAPYNQTLAGYMNPQNNNLAYQPQVSAYNTNAQIGTDTMYNKMVGLGTSPVVLTGFNRANTPYYQNLQNAAAGKDFTVSDAAMTGGTGYDYTGLVNGVKTTGTDLSVFDPGSVTSAVQHPSGLSGLWSGLGGAEGFANIAGGVSALGGLYYGIKENDRREGEYKAKMAEINRQKQRDIDWQNNINKSGLGTYSAGLGSK